ncbi:RING-H2 finger protein ATL1 [Linum grandiflorum]
MDPPPPLHSSESSFPIIAVAVIGIIATAFLLVSYYVFVIKCCLNWHRIDILRRFSLSRSRAHDQALISAARNSSSPTEVRGLDEKVIRSIPVIKYKKTEQERRKQEQSETEEASSPECAVCLSEFVEDEKLRRIPNCCHVFHVDCIDVWLQNNSNCPLCRTSISHPGLWSAPQDPSPTPYPERIENIGGDEDYVVIELGNYVTRSQTSSTDRTLREAQERLNSGELLIRPATRTRFGVEEEKKGMTKKMRSMGDECIDTRGEKKGGGFGIQPIRRSFSMDSSADRQLLLKIQEIVQQQSCNGQSADIISHVEGCSSGSNRSRRNFFSFGHSRGSKSSVLPVHLDP